MLSRLIKIYVFTRNNEELVSDDRIYYCADDFAREQGLLISKPFPCIERNEHKKPRFVDDIGVDFSVSHSGKYWVCAVSRQEVGIDIQNSAVKFKKNIAKRFFHKNEYEYLEKNDYVDFFSIWTAKESYVKYTGQGIDNYFSDFSVVENGKISERFNKANIKFIPIDSNYSLCVCAIEIEDVSISLCTI